VNGMRRVRVIWGVAIGLAASVLILAIVNPSVHRDNPARVPQFMLSDCDGAIRELVIQYVPGAKAVVTPIYAQFLRQLPAGVRVHVVCPERPDFDELAADIGKVSCELDPVIVHHDMTAWSRDRWIAFDERPELSAMTLLSPPRQDGADVWPARAGDSHIADDLAGAVHGVASVHSLLSFDGGDFDADARTVFVSSELPGRNVQKTVKDTQALLDELRLMFKQDVLALDGAPMHHVGMYLMPVGDNRVLVGDPSLASKVMSQADLAGVFAPAEPDFSPEAQGSFDAVARQCQAAGYKVVRIPTVVGKDARTYFTYVNAIIDCREHKRIVYMPSYRNADPLNVAARAVWEGLGYEVRPIDCTDAHVYFGTLHCLVNVLRRAPA